MFDRLILGAFLAGAVATTAQAAGPLQVSTNFPAPLSGVDFYKADLATLGVTFGLDSPATVQPAGPQTLEFRLLESHAERGGFQVFALNVGASSFVVPLQAFSGAGTLLGTVTTASNFGSLIGDTDTFGPNPPPFAFGAYKVYLSDADTAALTGIGPFIGDVDHLYFSIGDRALFEVSVAGGVPEPATWALMLAGFALVGLMVRRRAGRPELA